MFSLLLFSQSPFPFWFRHSDEWHLVGTWRYKNQHSHHLSSGHCIEGFVMDIDTRISIVKLYYANGWSLSLAMRAYRKLNKLHKDPFTISAVVKLIERFESTGSVHDWPRTGRPSLVEDRSEIVMDELERQKMNHPLGLASASSEHQELQKFHEQVSTEYWSTISTFILIN